MCPLSQTAIQLQFDKKLQAETAETLTIIVLHPMSNSNTPYWINV